MLHQSSKSYRNPFQHSFDSPLSLRRKKKTATGRRSRRVNFREVAQPTLTETYTMRRFPFVSFFATTITMRQNTVREKWANPYYSGKNPTTTRRWEKRRHISKNLPAPVRSAPHRTKMCRKINKKGKMCRFSVPVSRSSAMSEVIESCHPAKGYHSSRIIYWMSVCVCHFGLSASEHLLIWTKNGMTRCNSKSS